MIVSPFLSGGLDWKVFSVLFHCFHHLQQIGCNSADFGHKNTNYISNERYCPFLLRVDSFFQITSEKVEKSVYENPIFCGVCGNPHPPGT